MSRMYDRLMAGAAPYPRVPVPLRIPHPKITPAASQAEARQCWWDLLTAHYMEHQSGEMWVLMTGGHSELVLTQQCPDCQLYGRAFDACQRGDGIGDELAVIWK